MLHVNYFFKAPVPRYPEGKTEIQHLRRKLIAQWLGVLCECSRQLGWSERVGRVGMVGLRWSGWVGLDGWYGQVGQIGLVGLGWSGWVGQVGLDWTGWVGLVGFVGRGWLVRLGWVNLV